MLIVLSELAQGLGFLLSLASLYLLLGRALFLLPGTPWQARLPGALEALALATAICLASGLLFALNSRQPEPSLPVALLRTLPVQLFLWTVAVALILFLVSAYLEDHYVPLLWRNQPHEMSAAPQIPSPHLPLRPHASEL
jgi:hypothetical protein